MNKKTNCIKITLLSLFFIFLSSYYPIPNELLAVGSEGGHLDV